LEKVKANVPSTWLGLAVPAYVYEEGVHSIEDLNDYKDEFDSRIVGIEPGAGIMNSTEQVIETYDLDYDLESSSTPAMMAEVDAYIDDNDWIVFTIWEPHSAFARFDIQKLEDPEGIYGGGDVVYTITRNDFADDFPEVYEFFQNFQISADTQSAWILEYSDNERPPEEVAQEWVDNNQELVDEWWPS
jgi:glycine betaine/proline transport system substrate-binding protein